jgi:hypothetical protein
METYHSFGGNKYERRIAKTKNAAENGAVCQVYGIKSKSINSGVKNEDEKVINVNQANALRVGLDNQSQSTGTQGNN